MRDLALMLILLSCVGIAWHRPWLGVLGLAVFGYMAPHSYGLGFMKDFPAYLALFLGVAAGFARSWLRGEQKIRLPHDWRLWCLLALWAWFVFTTGYALAGFAAWPRLLEVSKSLLPLLFTLLLIDQRTKLFCLIATIALAFALVAFKGAYWALMTGFSDRVYGPPGGHFSDNNLFVVVAIMNLPLLMLWLREARLPAMRWVISGMLALSVVAVLSSWSRGGMVALAVTGALLLWDSKKKQVAVPLLLAGMACAFLLLPDQWFTRMETTLSYQGERSAESRLDVWQTGLSYVLTHPLTGTGFEGWQHVTQGDIDWHNSYVEMLVEHGPVGLALWLALLLGSMFSLTRLARAGDKVAQSAWIGGYSRALRASLAAYATGSLFLGISYWDLFFHLVVMSVILGSLARRAMADAGLATLPGRASAG